MGRAPQAAIQGADGTRAADGGVARGRDVLAQISPVAEKGPESWSWRCLVALVLWPGLLIAGLLTAVLLRVHVDHSDVKESTGSCDWKIKGRVFIGTTQVLRRDCTPAHDWVAQATAR